MEYLRVKNYRKYQNHQDGRRPPWIKFFLSTLDDKKFQTLPESTRCHLMLIWLFAADCGNKIPFDASEIGWRIRAESTVDLELLVAKGFLEVYTDKELVESCRVSCDSVEILAKPTKVYKNLRTSTKVYPEGEGETEGELEEETTLSIPTAELTATGPKVDELHRLNRFIEFWNTTATANKTPTVRIQKSIDKVRAHPDFRRILGYLKDAEWRKDAKQAVEMIHKCPHLLGQNDRGWKITLSFLAQPGMVEKIIEGNYLGKTVTNGHAHPPKADPYTEWRNSRYPGQATTPEFEAEWMTETGGWEAVKAGNYGAST